MKSWKKYSEETMTSIITVKGVPIPIFGKEEVNKVTYATKTLQLNAAFTSKGYAKVWQATKFANLPATKDVASQTDKQKATVKMNR